MKLKAVSTSKSRELEITRVTSDDNDKDGIKNDVDNCPDTYNPNQSDFDGDDIGDVCDSNHFLLTHLVYNHQMKLVEVLMMVK